MEKHRIQKAAWVVAVCLVSGVALAGEPVTPPVAVEEKPKAELPKGLAEKPFVFEKNAARRDPFIFVAKVEIPIEKTPGGDGDTKVPGTIISKEVIAKVKAEAEAAYADAERAFLEFSKEGKAVETIQRCDDGLKAFSPYPNPGTVAEWQEIREKLFDLRKAADRIRQRQDAKRKFEELNIRLTGIVARDRGSQAIVNSRTVRKGDVVAASESFDVVVDEIRADQVVFVFQGFKMALNLSEGPK